MNDEERFTKADELFDKGKHKEAFDLFLKAANNGHIGSMNRVAVQFYEGEGVDQDFIESMNWDLKSIAAGEGDAALLLAKLYMTSEKETDKVKHYLEIAISHPGMIEADVEEAEELYSKLFDE